MVTYGHVAAVTAYPLDPPEAQPRRVRLHVIGGYVDLDNVVPATRGDCAGGPRPCAHVRCRHHLWRLEPDEQPGRRWPGYTPPIELRPVQFDWPLPPSCALDEADRVTPGEMMPMLEVARCCDGGETQTRAAIRRAMAKVSERHGVIAPGASGAGRR